MPKYMNKVMEKAIKPWTPARGEEVSSTRSKERGLIRPSTKFMLSLAIIALLTASLLFVAGGVKAAPPSERDFFGIVVAIGDNLLQVGTEEGIVDVATSDDTMIRLPLKPNATLSDLVEGDIVAVSMDDELVASKIFVIPGKTQFRHVPGEAVSVTDGQITVRPLTDGAAPISFNITPDTKIKLREGATELVSGVFVIVLTRRDTLTGELSPDALEIHVTAVKPRSDEDRSSVIVTPVPANIARILGIFEGIDEDGNWLVSGILVIIDSDTEIESGIVVGQQVQVDGELLPDGSVLAHEIKALEDDYQVRSRTRLEGVFEGADADDNWLISGTTVIVGADTDTDGLPFVGQRVRLEGLVQEDGMFLAREVENMVGSNGPILLTPEIMIEGIFQGVDSDGNWLVNGTRVAVSKQTRLKGTPTVGSTIEIRAILTGDGILALRIEGNNGEDDEGSHSQSRIEFRGTVENIGGNTLIVDGNHVGINDATEVDGTLEAGAQVRIDAWLLDDGSILARKVERLDEDEESPEDASIRVSIEGTVDGIIDESAIVVNGVKVVISPDLETDGEFVEGKAIGVEGFFLEDGSIRATRIQGAGREASY
jgi:hypothetical protein